MMRRMFAAIARYRPRVLTLLVLFVVAALIALVNLNYEVRAVTDGDPQASKWTTTIRYGWPMSWHCYLLRLPWAGRSGIVGWHYSAGRLAGDSAIWLVMLAVPAGTCEWLARRYRPRLRWSLRTMLVAVALVAALCGWIATARKRADLQDSIIAAVNGNGQIWVERWGPVWLDHLGADRFRRQIFAVRCGIWEPTASAKPARGPERMKLTTT